MSQEALQAALLQQFPQITDAVSCAFDEVTFSVDKSQLYEVCLALRDAEQFVFSQLIDVCVVDYLNYGESSWSTESSTSSGFDRAVTDPQHESFSVSWNKSRYAVVYHLLSVSMNQRLRLRVLVDEEELMVPSVVDIWPAANWFEREAFDLYGVLFTGHPDLRRILTDYGFVGHPFRKDFPLSGHVEMRYDAALGRVVYEPVSIVPRILVPRVIRDETTTSKPDGESA